jgi:O-antigen/teichoic acid export membrane protein
LATIKKIILITAIKNISVNLIGLPINLICSLIIARQLGPEKSGLTATLIGLVLSYTILIHFGTLNALSQRFPLLVGKNSKESLIELSNMPKSILGFIILTSIFLFTALSFVSLFYYLNNNLTWAFGIFSAGILSVFQLIKTYSIFLCRSSNQFNKLTRNTIKFLWAPILIVGSVKYFGLYGQWIAMVLTEFLITFSLFKSLKIKFNFVFDFNQWIFYVKMGMPIFLVGALYDIFNTSDRLAAATILSSKELGIYSVATMSNTIISIIPMIVAQIMWPRIAEMIGADKPSEMILKYLRIPTSLLSLLLPGVIGIIFILLPNTIEVFLPKYSTGIQTAQISIFSIFFIGIFGMYTSYLGTSLKLLPYGLIILIGIIINWFAISILSTKVTFSLENIALIKVFSFAVIAILAILYVEFTLTKKFLKSIIVLLRLIFPILYLLFLLFFVIPKSILPYNISLQNEVIKSIVKITILLIFLIPNLILGIKKVNYKTLI